MKTYTAKYQSQHAESFPVCPITREEVREAGWEEELADETMRDIAKVFRNALGEAEAGQIFKDTVQWFQKARR